MDFSPSLVLFVDLSLGKGSVVGGEVSVCLLGSFEAGSSGHGFEGFLRSDGGCFAGFCSLGDFCVAQFWMFMDFGDGHESFSRESLAVDFRRESPWERIPYGVVCGQ